MEVNKVNSWEDVISDNYNAEPEVQKEEQELNDELSTDVESTNVDDEEQEVETGSQQEDSNTEEDDNEEYEEHQQQQYTNTADLDEDTLYEYLSLKKTDYNEVNDIDIVAGFISSENPNWDTEDIEFELEQKYGSALFEDKIDLEEIDKDIYPDEYKEAIKINKEIDRAQKLLRRDALDKRSELEELKQNIQLPTSDRNSTDNNVSRTSAEESESDQGLSPEQLQYLQQQWISSVERDVPSVSEFKFKLGDEEVSYKITQDEQREMVQKMKEFNAESYLVQRGWVKPDGTPDVKKITEDVYILENSEKMFKSGWTQAKESAKMDIIGRDIKNINLGGSTNQTFDVRGNDPYGFGNFVLDL